MRPVIAVAFVLLFPSVFLLAQHGEKYVPETDPLVQKNLERWQDLKFGLLMHWGPYSQWGVVESWSSCAEDEVWCRRNDEDYIAYKKKYESLPKTFNPARFDPGRWAAAARNAGNETYFCNPSLRPRPLANSMGDRRLETGSSRPRV